MIVDFHCHLDSMDPFARVPNSASGYSYAPPGYGYGYASGFTPNPPCGSSSGIAST